MIKTLQDILRRDHISLSCDNTFAPDEQWRAYRYNWSDCEFGATPEDAVSSLLKRDKTCQPNPAGPLSAEARRLFNDGLITTLRWAKWTYYAWMYSRPAWHQPFQHGPMVINLEPSLVSLLNYESSFTLLKETAWHCTCQPPHYGPDAANLDPSCSSHDYADYFLQSVAVLLGVSEAEVQRLWEDV